MTDDQLIANLIKDAQEDTRQYINILTKPKELIDKLITRANVDLERKEKSFIAFLNKHIEAFGNTNSTNNGASYYTQDAVLTAATELEAVIRRNEWYLKILETYKQNLIDRKQILDKNTPQEMTGRGGRTIKPRRKPRRKTNRRR